MIFKKRIFITIAAVGLLWVRAVSAAQDGSIQIKGSDTMVNLGQAWAEEYMNRNPDAYVAVTGGGSGTGIAALMSGTCDIAETSRHMKQKEIDAAKANNIYPKEFTVALDGLAVVVNPENPVNQLTIQQLADIFTAKIKNWKEVGGEDLEIVRLSREVTSGTHEFFREHIIKGGNKKSKEEFAPSCLLMPSSQAVAEEIALNPNAIGYYGMGYSSSNQKILAVAENELSPYYKPSIDNVKKGHYYISRPLLMNTNGEPEGLVKDFLDFVFSPDGQQVVRNLDFVPIR